jgi:hypothetical protein
VTGPGAPVRRNLSIYMTPTPSSTPRACKR